MSSDSLKAKARSNKINEMTRRLFDTSRDAIISKIINSQESEEEDSEEIDITEPYEMSKTFVGNYVTLDYPHWVSIRNMRETIADYAADRTRVRPLNILMQAAPGSGKSHLVRCLSNALRRPRASTVECNMASFQRADDLLQPLDEVRNLKVADRLPVLFLDEFDSEENRYPMLLPLLWDGQINIGHRNLKLGKLVIILAGSKRCVSDAMKQSKTMMPKVEDVDGTKLVDLLSRINGGEIDIPSLELQEGSRDRRVDKVCLALSLLQSRFGDSLELVPLSLLYMIAVSHFQHGVRSMAHFIDCITPPFTEGREMPKAITTENLVFPMSSPTELQESTLSYHLCSAGGPEAIIDTWRSASARRTVVRFQGGGSEDQD